MSLTTVLHTLISALAGEVVIMADQNSPRPVLPYWTMRLNTQARLGRDSQSNNVDNNGIQIVRGVREATCQLQRYGANAFDICNDLRNNLSKQSELDKWQLAKVSVYNSSNVLNVPFKLNDLQFEPRATVDLFIRVGIELQDNVGVIETVTTTMQLDGNAELTKVVTVVL